MNERAQDTCGAGGKETLTCISVASQHMDVSVPLKLKPYTTVGKAVTQCCGEPIVVVRSCQGASGSCGCEIVITQTVCIQIPIEYGTDAAACDMSPCNHTSDCGNNSGGFYR